MSAPTIRTLASFQPKQTKTKKIAKADTKPTKLKTLFHHQFSFKIQTLDYYSSEQCKLQLGQLLRHVGEKKEEPKDDSLAGKIRQQIRGGQQVLVLNKEVVVGQAQLQRRLKRQQRPQLVVVVYDDSRHESYWQIFMGLYLQKIPTLLVNKQFPLGSGGLARDKSTFLSFYGLEDHLIDPLLALAARCSLVVYQLVHK